ncbi:MAG: hypothetical protein LBJ01_11745 [Tannerella sp.]|nr:hypothetical protein [Tannerella sp.]
MILCLGAVSCSDDLYEPATKSSGYVNTVRKDDISFKLSLLNEEGKPATVFREGENFSFRFEMENLRENDKREYPGQLLGNLYVNGFSHVFNQNGDWVGSPFSEGGACTKELSSFPFEGDNRPDVTVPWNGSNEEEWWKYRSCDFTWSAPAVLPKGDYYTGFTYTFNYRITPNTWVETGPVTMRIDFTVE